jgi:hypothetical protein
VPDERHPAESRSRGQKRVKCSNRFRKPFIGPAVAWIGDRYAPELHAAESTELQIAERSLDGVRIEDCRIVIAL